MFGELVQLAIRNLLRARARLVMTSGGVLVGTAAVIMLLAMTNGLQRAAELGIGQNESLTRFNVAQKYQWNPDGSPGPEFPKLTIAAIEQFKKVEGVLAVIAMKNLNSGPIVTDNSLETYTSIYGIDPAVLPLMSITLESGSLDLKPGQNQIILSGQVSQYFYDPTAEEWEPVEVDVMTEPLSMVLYQQEETRTINLSVVGVTPTADEGPDAYRSYMHMDDVLRLNEFTSGEPLDPETFSYDEVLVIAANRDVTAAASRAIKEMDYEVWGAIEFLEQLNGFFNTMRYALGGVGAIALLVAAFGVANTMTMAILERTREIGLMKAVGATNRDVLTVFVVEAGLVGFVGGAAGVGVSLLLQNLINSFVASLSAGGGENQGGGFSPMFIDLSQMNGQIIVIDSQLIVFAMIIATGVGVAAGLYPAYRAAARLEPVIALKAE